MNTNASKEDMELVQRVIALSDGVKLAEFRKMYRFWKTNGHAYWDIIPLIRHTPSLLERVEARAIDDPDPLNMDRRFVGLWDFYQQDPARYDPERYRAQFRPPYKLVGGPYATGPMMDNFARRLMLDLILLEYRDVLPDVPYSSQHSSVTFRQEFEERLKRWETARAAGRHVIDYAARLECNWYSNFKLKPDGKPDWDTYPPCDLGHGVDPVLDKNALDCTDYPSSDDEPQSEGNWYNGWHLKFSPTHFSEQTLFGGIGRLPDGTDPARPRSEQGH